LSRVQFVLIGRLVKPPSCNNSSCRFGNQIVETEENSRRLLKRKRPKQPSHNLKQSPRRILVKVPEGNCPVRKQRLEQQFGTAPPCVFISRLLAEKRKTRLRG
jgi:hypothetical protein